MKLRSLISVLATSAVVAGSIAVGSDLVQAKSQYKFVCEQNSKGTPTTFAIALNGEKREFINWRSDQFTLAGYPPQVRCEQVTGRMSQYVISGAARYLSHGTMNNQPVICVTDKKGGGCTGLLYTLKPHQDARGTLRDLLELNRRNFKNDPLIEGESCRTYVDINAMVTGKLQRAEVVCNAR